MGLFTCICCTENCDDTVPQIKNGPDIIAENMGPKLKRDLIVDDSDPNRTVIRKYLARYKRTADEVSNGDEAINIIKKNGTYDIVWMDIQMPRMNGIKCTEYLRNTLGYKGTIIGLTGHVDIDSVNECKKAGMQTILAKPIDKKILEAYIEQY